ncbi:MAG: hypothetical protein ACRD0G_15585 [Acidimicrobiales bacterium]
MTKSRETAVEDFAELANETVEDWTRHAKAMAAKVESGPYTADDAVKDLSACASVALNGLVGLVNLALETAGAKPEAGQDDLKSETFTLETAVNDKRTLTLTAPLASGLSTNAITSVTFDPNPLGANERDFTFVANVSGLQGGLYVGKAAASPTTKSSTAAPETIEVWLQVP